MTKGVYYGGGRKKLPDNLKAKMHSFRLYEWEVKKVKEFIRTIRSNPIIKGE